ncbi:MAG TPA: ribonuclease HII [Nitrososphaera sp.]|nr:ribonuclease HII [Nitrososphaera sp.]
MVMQQFVLGIDEAGRGPLAGPVAVGIVKVHAGFNIKKHFVGVADSKKLSEAQREALYARILEFSRIQELTFTVLFASAALIDKKGITYAVQHSIYKGVKTIAPEPRGVQVLLDGLLHAPEEYSQETIIRGDASEPIISLASIAAKVERDRLMKRLAKQYPQYGFEKHKGYGTSAHYQAIKEFGLCDIHRKSWRITDIDAKVAAGV